MFDQFKMLGTIAGFLKNRDQIKDVGDRIQSRLSAMRIEGTSEGNLVRVVVNGKMDVETIELSPTLASGLAGGGENKRLGETLIAEAVNDAIGKAQQAVADVIDEEGEALGMGGLGEQLRQFMPR